MLLKGDRNPKKNDVLDQPIAKIITKKGKVKHRERSHYGFESGIIRLRFGRNTLSNQSGLGMLVQTLSPSSSSVIRFKYYSPTSDTH